MGNIPSNVDPPTPPPTAPPKSKLNDGEIAGVVIGSFVGFIIVAIIFARDYGYIKDIPQFLESVFYSQNSIVSSIQHTLDDRFKYFKDLVQDNESRETLIRYSVIYAFIIIVAVILYYASSDRSALNTNAFVYSISIIIPLILMIYFFFPQTTGGSRYSNMIIIGFAFLIMMSVGYFYSTFKINSIGSNFIDYIFYGIIGLVVLFLLTILFLFTSNYLKTLTGWTGFIVYFIFYIPCLLVDFINYIRKELSITTNVIYIIFFLEIISIILYIYYPQILRFVFKRDGILLLKESWYLDYPRILSGANSIAMIEPDPFTDPSKEKSVNIFRKDYSISMWINLNSQPPTYSSYSKENPIFCYGQNGKGKPLITYYNDSDSEDIDKKDKLLFYFSNKSDQPNATVYINKQKWNYIVVNYKNQICDVFVNGNLETSFQLSNENFPTYDLGDTITIGSKDGLYGALCNIKFFFRPLTKMDIINTYNLLMNKNPPTPIS
jgi:hypothetical protein